MFLDYFNLKKLSELPALEDIKDFDSINPDLFEELEGEAKEKAQTEADTDTNVDSETQIAEISATEEQDDEALSDEGSSADDEIEVVDETQAERDDDMETVAIEPEKFETDKQADEESGTNEAANVVPFSN